MDYREHIGQLKAEWIGKKVIYENELHTVIDVDYNGALLIDKKAQYTETTAVGIGQVRLNCAGCKWLDQMRHYAKGEGYCCMVQRSKTYKPGDKARYSNMARCDLYEAGEFAERYSRKETR